MNDYNEVPILKLELNALKHSMAHALIERNDEINKLILKQLDKTLTMEWVGKEIALQVDEALRNAMKDVSSNYKLKQILRDNIIAHIVKSMGGEKDGS